MADPKRKTEAALRTPGPKKKLGLVVPPPLRMPHDELIIGTNEPPERISSLTSQTTMPGQPSQTNTLSQTESHQTTDDSANQLTESVNKPNKQNAATLPLSMPSQTSQSTLPTQTRHSQSSSPPSFITAPIAPERDFTRVANSITREAVPAGVFKGKSKHLYDCLYRLTRGAVVPSRSVRISRPKLMKAAGIGSRVTFDTNISHLCQVGLIEVRSIVGEHDGNEYTVYIPEERSFTLASMTGQASHTRYGHELDRPVSLETSQTSHTTSPTESMSLDVANTFQNTTTDDDDGINTFAGIIRVASSALIGQNLPKSDVERDRWRDLALLLSEELKRAAERAGQISSVPAFFAAHLRRRLKAGPSAISEPRQDSRPVKSQAESPSKEQRLSKMIRELQLLHVGDPDYRESDLIDDLRFRCDKAGLSWDEGMIQALLNPPENKGREGEG